MQAHFFSGSDRLDNGVKHILPGRQININGALFAPLIDGGDNRLSVIALFRRRQLTVSEVIKSVLPGTAQVFQIKGPRQRALSGRDKREGQFPGPANAQAGF